MPPPPQFSGCGRDLEPEGARKLTPSAPAEWSRFIWRTRSFPCLLSPGSFHTFWLCSWNNLICSFIFSNHKFSRHVYSNFFREWNQVTWASFKCVSGRAELRGAGILSAACVTAAMKELKACMFPLLENITTNPSSTHRDTEEGPQQTFHCSSAATTFLGF